MINDENFVWEPRSVVFSKRSKIAGKYTYIAEIRAGMHNYIISGKEHITREAAQEEAEKKEQEIKMALKSTLNLCTKDMKLAKE